MSPNWFQERFREKSLGRTITAYTAAPNSSGGAARKHLAPRRLASRPVLRQLVSEFQRRAQILGAPLLWPSCSPHCNGSSARCTLFGLVKTQAAPRVRSSSCLSGGHGV